MRLWRKRRIRIEDELLFALLDVTRLAHIYVLKDSHREELGDDFKPHKWDGYEIEFAHQASDAHRALLQTACAQRGIPYERSKDGRSPDRPDVRV